MRKPLIFLILLTALFPSSCHRQSPGVSSLVIGIEGTPTNLDPGYATDAYSMQIADLCFEGLVRFDRKGELVPWLAADFSVRRNDEIAVTLRRGIRFQDGTVFTSGDVAATINRILDSPAYSPYKEALSHIQNIVLQGPDGLVIRMKEPYAPLLTALTIGILPHRLAAEKNLPPEKLIGTGPYRIYRYDVAHAVELRAFAGYWGGPPRIQRLLFRVVPNDLTRVLELEKGSIDLLVNAVPPDAVGTLRHDKHVRVITGQGNSYEYLGFNMRDPLLRIPAVRRAIAHAIDRQAIISSVLFNEAEPATGILPPWNKAYDGNVQQYGYNPAEAEQLLDEAGFPRRHGYRFTLDFKTSNNPLSIRVAQAIAYELGQIGIKVNLRSYEWATFYNDIRHGNFQLYTLRWVNVMDPDIYYYAFDSRAFPPSGANRGYYANSEVDQLLGQARSILNSNASLPVYRHIQRIIARDLPYVSLWYMKDITAMRDRVRGFRPFPGGGYRGINKAYIVREQP